MGARAYNRGTALVARQIAEDFAAKRREGWQTDDVAELAFTAKAEIERLKKELERAKRGIRSRDLVIATERRRNVLVLEVLKDVYRKFKEVTPVRTRQDYRVMYWLTLARYRANRVDPSEGVIL